MTPLSVADSPSLKGSIEVPPLLKVTVVAGEPVEVQVRVEGEDPGVRLVMVGAAGGRHENMYWYTVCICIMKPYKYVCTTALFQWRAYPIAYLRWLTWQNRATKCLARISQTSLIVKSNLAQKVRDGGRY